MSLAETKRAIAVHLQGIITSGLYVDGQVLPPHQIIGRGENDLQARVIYRDCAQFYFQVQVT